MAWPALLCAAVVLAAGGTPRPDRTGRPSSPDLAEPVWLGVVALAASIATGSTTALVALAVVVLVVVVALRSWSPPRPSVPVLRALGAAGAMVVLLRLGPDGFHGASGLLTMAAVGPLAASSFRWPAVAPSRNRRVFRRAMGGFVIAELGALVLAGLLAQRGAAGMRQALDATRQGQTEEAAGHVDAAHSGFSQSGWLADVALLPLRVVPVLSQHVEALQVSTHEAAAVSRATADVLAVGGYEDLKVGGGRLDLARVASLVAPTGRAEERLDTARKRLGGLDSGWLVPPVRSVLLRFEDEARRAGAEADLAGEAARVLPGLLGGDGERVYFVAFLNPAEQRGGGGFLGSYTELRAVDGRLTMTRAASILELIAAAPRGSRTLDGPADYLARYGGFNPQDFLQDATFSPHFPYTAEVIGQLYPQSGGSELDGVLALDSFTLAALLEFTGPVSVDGFDEPLTSETAARVLVQDQYEIYDDLDQVDRRDFLDQLAEITFERLVDGALPGPGPLVETLAPKVRERRLLFHSSHRDEQRFVERIGMDGSLPVGATDDLLLVSHQNLGNSKIDTYLRRSTTAEVTVDALSGKVDTTVTIGLENTAPPNGLPRYILGNARGEPFGSNVMQLSVYSPLAYRSGPLEGTPLAIRPEREAGSRVYTTRVVIPPQGQRTVAMRLEGYVDVSDGRYDLEVVPQPTVQPDQVEATVRSAPRNGAADGSGATAGRARGPLTEPEVVELELSPG